MQRVLFVHMRKEKSWNNKPKETMNIYFLIWKVLKHWIKWNKKSIFNLQRIRHMAKPYAPPHEVSLFIYILMTDFTKFIYDVKLFPL